MTRKKDLQELDAQLEMLPQPDILALAESCVAVAAAQFAAGIRPTAEEQAILDRALAAHPQSRS